MNANMFKEYFKQMLNFIPEGLSIVMDNAKYRSRQTEQFPITTWKKENIRQWLFNKNISFKDDLLPSKIGAYANRQATHTFTPSRMHVVDEMTKKLKITVLRLTLNHCELNPIQLIWAHVKGDVAINNTTYKPADFKKLFKHALHNVTALN
ncbi:uncharacterized protein [Diabrotica undecimpunctata]|uniref:uncharacterized protein n=1 Tax=Diabrotica undecimpunctata TaxID=50387 RepID=UPI003B63E054